MRHINRKIGASLLMGALMWAPVMAPLGAQAAEEKKVKSVPVELEPWPGRRVVLLLPLQLGVGFNADREFGNLVLPRAEAELARALEATGKFSVVQVHRFSPLVQRGLQEKRVTEEQVRSVIAEPVSIDSAMNFISQYAFDQAPMIADFRLEEVRSSIPAPNPKMKSKMKVGTPSVQAQVSGRLYQAGEAVAYKAPVVTSAGIQVGNNNIERYLYAVSDAFTRIATEFTAPLEDVTLPTANSVPATSVENATTPIGGAAPNAVTTPNPNANNTTSPVPTPPDAKNNAPITPPQPANPIQGNPLPANAPAQAQ